MKTTMDHLQTIYCAARCIVPIRSVIQDKESALTISECREIARAFDHMSTHGAFVAKLAMARIEAAGMTKCKRCLGEGWISQGPGDLNCGICGGTGLVHKT
jgi:hypothetical protein